METALRTVGLRPEETLGRYPHQLSGGQRQRITVARALLLKPRLIIADEPVSMVDASLRATILESLRQLQSGLRHLLPLHHARPDDGLSGERQHHRPLSRVGRRDGRCGAGHQGPAAPLYATARLLHPPAGPGPALGRGCRRGGAIQAGAGETVAAQFADRCPYVMPMCRESPPPLYRTSPHRAVACYLYRDAGDTLDGDITQTFRAPLVATTGGA